METEPMASQESEVEDSEFFSTPDTQEENAYAILSSQPATTVFKKAQMIGKCFNQSKDSKKYPIFNFQNCLHRRKNIALEERSLKIMKDVNFISSIKTISNRRIITEGSANSTYT
jgi:hypothetical protein